MNIKPYILGVSICMFFIACNSDNSSKSIAIDTNQNNTENNETKTENNETTVVLKNASEYVDRLYEHKTHSTFDFGSSQTLVNKEASVTAMCYTKHEQQYNPCYICHQDQVPDGRANYMDDGELQNEYLFSEYGFNNRWSNLFLDRSEKIAKISDTQIDSYVNSENYTKLKGFLEDNNFTGYIPDLENYQLGAEAFDKDGFAKDGSGWVAFNYKPLPSTFWPVNGSTDDVLIRLHKDMRKTEDGNLSITAYKFNLAIVEAAIKNIESISVDNLDENEVGVDLNKDGVLGDVNEIKRPEYYVGKASYMKVEAFLYPKYTEFLHTVRYVGADKNGTIYNAPRMKELRYMIKEKSYQDDSYPMTKYQIALRYDDEKKEREQGSLPVFSYPLPDKGLVNGMGWWVQGFIEDAQGELRLQNHEETFYCMGCHTNLGSTIDSVFSFARKVEGKDGWGYVNLKKIADVPNIGENEGEILTYLKRVGGGSEFRAYNDIHTKFYSNGVLDEGKVKAVSSIYELITPTRASALKMNKSYKVVVEGQDFIHGREGNDAPVKNVYSSITEQTPTLPVEKQYKWDMRLDWSKQGN